MFLSFDEVSAAELGFEKFPCFSKILLLFFSFISIYLTVSDSNIS